MSQDSLVAHASTVVEAGRADVWRALTDPAALRQWMMGADVASDWRAGSPITWKGEFQGKRFEDRGSVLEAVPEKLLRYTHFSPMSGKPDEPANYHTVTITLAGTDWTEVTLAQDNNTTEDARRESERNWMAMLGGLKRHVEGTK